MFFLKRYYRFEADGFQNDLVAVICQVAHGARVGNDQMRAVIATFFGIIVIDLLVAGVLLLFGGVSDRDVMSMDE